MYWCLEYNHPEMRRRLIKQRVSLLFLWRSTTNVFIKERSFLSVVSGGRSCHKTTTSPSDRVVLPTRKTCALTTPGTYHQLQNAKLTHNYSKIPKMKEIIWLTKNVFPYCRSVVSPKDSGGEYACTFKRCTDDLCNSAVSKSMAIIMLIGVVALLF